MLRITIRASIKQVLFRMRSTIGVRFPNKKKRKRAEHEAPLAPVPMGKSTADENLVHSDDRLYTIRLGNAITKPKEKIKGQSAAVREAILVNLRARATKSTPPKAAPPDHKRGMAALAQSYMACHLDETLSAGQTPAQTAAETQERSTVISAQTNGLATTRDGQDDQEIIVKIFRVEHGVKSAGRAETEIAALKQLKTRGCKHAPIYLGDFEKIEVKPDGVPGATTRYVLMTKLPGRSLADGGAWRVVPMQMSRVPKAFDVAVKDVHRCGVYNNSPVLRNVMWDAEEGKCYIVDFERADLTLSAAEMPAEWSDFDWWCAPEYG